MNSRVYSRKIIEIAKLTNEINSILSEWSEYDFDPEDSATINELHLLASKRARIMNEVLEDPRQMSSSAHQRAIETIELGAL